MSDRELLELAAKAAGIDISEWCEPIPHGCAAGFILQDTIGDIWNPLEFDGDALRLACRLHINVFIYHDETSTATLGVVAKNWGGVEANTRRAIVRAAAEIGKSIT